MGKRNRVYDLEDTDYSQRSGRRKMKPRKKGKNDYKRGLSDRRSMRDE